MIGKRILIGAACLMAMQGAVAQVDGVTGASVQTANTSSCKGKKQCCNTPAEQLKVRLQKLLNKGIMLGHQDDPVYGTTWKCDEGKSDVFLTTGDYPAVMGFDLGKIELDSKEISMECLSIVCEKKSLPKMREEASLLLVVILGIRLLARMPGIRKVML